MDKEEVPGNVDSAPPGDKKTEFSPAELQNKEANSQTPDDSADQQSSEPEKSLYSQKGQVKTSGLIRGPQGKIKKKLAISASVASATIIASIVVFILLLPLKINNIVQNIQNRFYATSENAVQKESVNLFSGYLRTALKNCKGGEINKDCNPIPKSSNPVTRLYKGWQNARLEDKLATNYGLEFSYNPRSKAYYMKTPDTGSKQIDISSFVKNDGESLDDALSKINDTTLTSSTRNQIRQAVDDALGKETKWKQVMYKYKVGRLLEEKYGIKRCITDIGCKISDKVTDTLAKPKKAAQTFIAERVLMPRSQILGTVFECLYIDPNCKPQDATPQPCVEGEDCEAGGAPTSTEDREIQSTLDKLVASFAGDDAYEIYQKINDSGSISKYLFQQVATKIWGETQAKTLSDKIPIVGWINLASQVILKAQNIGPAVKKLTYATNAASMVQMYSLYRTYADEIKSGHVDATEVGSFTDSLGSVSDASKGGTASAEQSPLYNDIINGNGPTTSSSAFLNDLSSGKAYAASSDDICDNGKPITGEICPEENLQAGNNITDAVSDFTHKPGVNVLTEAANIWAKSGGVILNHISNIGNYILGKTHLSGVLDSLFKAIVPGYSKAKKESQSILSDAVTAGVNYAIPNPFSDNNGGDRNFELAAGGGDVSGSDYAHYGLGGEALSDQQVADIVNQQNQQQLQQYNSESFFARMFDTGNNNSLVTKIAMAMPNNSDAARSDIASIFTNPLGKLANIFGVFSIGHANAAVIANGDPFGVTQYGYPDNDPIFNTDAQTYWNQNCADNPVVANGAMTQAWDKNASKNLNPNTEMPENLPKSQGGSGTDPCLLIQATTGSDGAVYDSSLLTKDDLADTSATAATPVTPTAPTTPSNQCAQGTDSLGQFDGYDNGVKTPITLCAVNGLTVIKNPKIADDQDSSESIPGTPYYIPGAKNRALVNADVSGQVVALVQAAKADGINIQALSSFRSMAHQTAACGKVIGTGSSAVCAPPNGGYAPPGYSTHQMGRAIDFVDTNYNSTNYCKTIPGHLASDGTTCIAPDSPTWVWLTKNADSYGFSPLASESWHWSATPDQTATQTPIAGNAQQIAQQILDNKNIDLSSYTSSVLQDVQDAAAGKPGTAGVMTSATILGLIESVGQSHKVLITAIQSNGQGHCNNTPKSGCPGDPHYTGDAVDFGSLDGVGITGRNAPALTVISLTEDLLPSGSGYGQSECGATPTLPSGITTFNDTCDHLHIQVPQGTP